MFYLSDWVVVSIDPSIMALDMLQTALSIAQKVKELLDTFKENNEEATTLLGRVSSLEPALMTISSSKDKIPRSKLFMFERSLTSMIAVLEEIKTYIQEYRRHQFGSGKLGRLKKMMHTAIQIVQSENIQQEFKDFGAKISTCNGDINTCL
jgi:hypothetical protein